MFERASAFYLIHAVPINGCGPFKLPVGYRPNCRHIYLLEKLVLYPELRLLKLQNARKGIDGDVTRESPLSLLLAWPTRKALEQVSFSTESR